MKKLARLVIGILIPWQAVADTAVKGALLETAFEQATQSPSRIQIEWKNPESPKACSATVVQRKQVGQLCSFKLLTTRSCATASADTLAVGAPFKREFSRGDLTIDFSGEEKSAVGIVSFEAACVDVDTAMLSPVNPSDLGSLCHVRYEHQSASKFNGLFTRAYATVNSTVGFLRDSANGLKLEPLAPARPAALKAADIGSPVFCEIGRKPVLAGMLTNLGFAISSTSQLGWVRSQLGIASDRAPGIFQQVSRTLAVLPIEDADPRVLRPQAH